MTFQTSWLACGRDPTQGFDTMTDWAIVTHKSDWISCRSAFAKGVSLLEYIELLRLARRCKLFLDVQLDGVLAHVTSVGLPSAVRPLSKLQPYCITTGKLKGLFVHVSGLPFCLWTVINIHNSLLFFSFLSMLHIPSHWHASLSRSLISLSLACISSPHTQHK